MRKPEAEHGGAGGSVLVVVVVDVVGGAGVDIQVTAPVADWRSGRGTVELVQADSTTAMATKVATEPSLRTVCIMAPSVVARGRARRLRAEGSATLRKRSTMTARSG